MKSLLTLLVLFGLYMAPSPAFAYNSEDPNMTAMNPVEVAEGTVKGVCRDPKCLDEVLHPSPHFLSTNWDNTLAEEDKAKALGSGDSAD